MGILKYHCAYEIRCVAKVIQSTDVARRIVLLFYVRHSNITRNHLIYLFFPFSDFEILLNDFSQSLEHAPAHIFAFLGSARE